MSTADDVLKGIDIATRIATAVADAFGLDREQVLHIAKGALPELKEPAEPQASRYFDARREVLGDEGELDKSSKR